MQLGDGVEEGEKGGMGKEDLGYGFLLNGNLGLEKEGEFEEKI